MFDSREQFYNDYPFQIRPATDDCPYFSQFLRLGMLAELIHKIGRNAIPFIEWGYLILIAMLIQAVLAGLILILLPLLFLRKRPVFLTSCDNYSASRNQTSNLSTGQQGAGKWRICGYFLSLGIGFMLIEMAFIQKFLLLLSYPTYAVAVVLCAFLVFAGFGSFCCPHVSRICQKFRFHDAIPAIIIVLALIAFAYLLLLSPIFDQVHCKSGSAEDCCLSCTDCTVGFLHGNAVSIRYRTVKKESTGTSSLGRGELTVTPR